MSTKKLQEKMENMINWYVKVRNVNNEIKFLVYNKFIYHIVIKNLRMMMTFWGSLILMALPNKIVFYILIKAILERDKFHCLEWLLWIYNKKQFLKI